MLKYFNDLRAYVTGDGDYRLNPDALDSWAYPLDLDFTLRREDVFYAPKDAAGLPLRQYQSVGAQYNPTRIAAYALANYNRWLGLAGEENRRKFLQCADWFVAAPGGLWHYTFDWNDLRAPWLSCMAQGEGISVLVRAFLMTNDERYLVQARKAVIPFARPLESGGVRSRLDGDGDFLEEYPSRSPSHVLNGFMYALIGIHDLMRVDPECAMSAGFFDLVETLVANIAKWDLGFWSAYDLAPAPTWRRNASTVAYQRLHVTQLTYLGGVLGNVALSAMAVRWERQCESFACRTRALRSKLLYRLLVRTQR